jgi:hypothetical protein
VTDVGLDLPPWNLWPSLLTGVAEVARWLVGPTLAVVIVFYYRQTFGEILLAVVALIDRATYLKIFGIILKAPERVRSLPGQSLEMTSQGRRKPTKIPNVVSILEEHKSRPFLAETLLPKPPPKDRRPDPK